ncbi:hypothetical protein BS78_05G141500 [Paspalum vaginatum]|uniref:Uncharacterized protein n=1 Tax=Paspalum vaginatum TaxID=158149 RepID=A0A9W7XCI4_9POAL|nr:hypothetical protein BS78_K032400 [Paspalum vaginatum]KAJ1275514.1 hypothetical protein BS78_05G141500 [Paspalum vaginatum]
MDVLWPTRPRGSRHRPSRCAMAHALASVAPSTARPAPLAAGRKGHAPLLILLVISYAQVVASSRPARRSINPPLPPASSGHRSSSSPSPCPRPPTSCTPPACFAGRRHDGAHAGSPLSTFVQLQPISRRRNPTPTPHPTAMPQTSTPSLFVLAVAVVAGAAAPVSPRARLHRWPASPMPLPAVACAAAPVLQPPGSAVAPRPPAIVPPRPATRCPALLLCAAAPVLA